MGFILAPISLFLFAFIGSIHSLITIVINISKRAFFRKTSKIKYTFALNVDILGNYLFKDTFNFTLLKKGYIYFGIFGETISSALGRMLRDGKANYFGYFVAYTLNIIWFTDWFKGGHCKASIMTDEKIKEHRLRITK